MGPATGHAMGKISLAVLPDRPHIVASSSRPEYLCRVSFPGQIRPGSLRSPSPEAACFYRQDSTSACANRLLAALFFPKREFLIVTGFLTFYLQDAAQSPFFVQQQRLQTIEPAQATEFQNRISEIIQRQVNPAFKSLLNYVSHEYADRAPERVGLSQYPAGN